MSETQSCLIIGSGWMAQEYLKAAKFLPQDKFSVYAPSERNKEAITKLNGKFYTDLNLALTEAKPTHVIVASSVESLVEVSKKVLELKINNVLIEKPAYLHRPEGEDLLKRAGGKNVLVGYNRRFYASANKPLEMIKANDEKFVGVQFEFTELATDVTGTDKFSTETKEHWAHANSSHVIDFAFFPVGLPQENRWQAYKVGSLTWHPSAAQMVGSGLTEKGIPFSYSAYWGGVGRWSTEWITDKTRYIFRPMEKLQVQRLGTFSYQEIDLEWKYEGAKHGLVEQLKGFLHGEGSGKFLTLQQSLKLNKAISEIAGYK